MMRSITAVLLASLMLATLAASPIVDGRISPGEYAGSAEFPDGAFRISWTLSGDTAALALQAKTSGWVSIGFGPETMMQGADMVFAGVTPGQPGWALDCYATGPTGPHPVDTELGGSADIAEFAVTENDGVTTLEFTRRTSTADRFDKPIMEGMAILWAWGSDDDFNSYHAGRGAGFLKAAPVQQASATVVSGESPGTRILAVLSHALPLSLSLTLMVTTMLVARYGKKNKRWLSIHKSLGVSAGILGLVGLLMAIRMVSLSTGIHFRVPHAFLGTGTLVTVVAAPLLGLGIFKIKKAKPTVRVFHRWIGRIAVTLMGLTVLSGLIQAGIL